MELLAALDEKEPEWVAAFAADMLAQGRFWWKPFTHFVRQMKAPDPERVPAAAVDAGLAPSVTRQRCLPPCISTDNDTTFISQSSRFCQHSEDNFVSNFASVGVLNEVAEVVLALARIVLEHLDKTTDNKGRNER